MISKTTPVKTQKIYTCCVCQHKSGTSFEVTTASGAVKHRCWTCLTPTDRAAYTAANQPETHCKKCKQALVLIGRTTMGCPGCRTIASRCTCQPDQTGTV